jgi:hypothetical protein
VRAAMCPDSSKSGRQLMIAIARSRRTNAVGSYCSSSIGGERARPMTTVGRQLPAAAMSTATRLSLHQAPPPLYPVADPICQSRRLPRSRLPGAFKSIVSARRTVLPMPARGFLPRGLSDACPRSLPHCQVTGRHLITLNDCGFWGRPAVPCQTLRKNTATSGSSARVREAQYPTNLSAAFATAALDPISGP